MRMDWIVWDLSTMQMDGISSTERAGFSWGSVHLIHNSYYGATFGIWAENTVDNTGIF